MSWGIVDTLRWRKRDAEVVVVYGFFFLPPVCSPVRSVSWVDVVVGFMFGIQLQTNAANPMTAIHPADLLFHRMNSGHRHLYARTRLQTCRPFG